MQPIRESKWKPMQFNNLKEVNKLLEEAAKAELEHMFENVRRIQGLHALAKARPKDTTGT